jgi:hypothetical protein
MEESKGDEKHEHEIYVYSLIMARVPEFTSTQEIKIFACLEPQNSLLYCEFSIISLLI